MPNMADITVKNVAGTDVVFNSATPSSGDKTPAVWRQNLASGVASLRPQLQLQTQDNGQGTVRRADVTFTFPVTYNDAVTGLPKSNGSVKIVATVNLPNGLSTDQWKEAFTQWGNLMTSTLVRSSIETGFAPT